MSHLWACQEKTHKIYLSTLTKFIWAAVKTPAAQVPYCTSLLRPEHACAHTHSSELTKHTVISHLWPLSVTQRQMSKTKELNETPGLLLSYPTMLEWRTRGRLTAATPTTKQRLTGQTGGCVHVRRYITVTDSEKVLALLWGVLQQNLQTVKVVPLYL